ncbi:hypothetical protein CHCC19466_3334 [Bacillus licheniformis]|nr:hypothetical protein CHCC20373_2383 [Bacillus licheniformis]TWL12380.1 hypothetical protein CHCC19466_3334 [Bacillus licheniformis]TWL19059.1 hypothetical protein CHCC16874_2341 [Bacillus licheniformis]TWL84375.1 hypothetical protein CHCC15291_2385 [Bacillus licheniformis]TWM05693.1 hypothetical protein CHCC15289_2113 [Bacillus licheniformis]
MLYNKENSHYPSVGLRFYKYMFYDEITNVLKRNLAPARKI